MRIYPRSPREDCSPPWNRLATLLARVLIPTLVVLGGHEVSRAQTGWINEFHYDNDGIDVDEFVEIVLQDPVAFQLEDVELVLYNGGTGTTYREVAGSELEIGASTPGFTLYTWRPSDLQNGHDGIALSYRGTLLDFVSYEGALTATDGPASGSGSTDVGIEEAPDTPAGSSLQRTGAGGRGSDFTWSGPAPASSGLLNDAQTLATIPLGLLDDARILTPGDTASIAVEIGDPDEPVADLVGIGFELHYDPALFTFFTHATGAFLTPDTLEFLHHDETAGRLAFGLSRQAPTSGNSGTGVLATFDFLVNESLPSDTTARFDLADVLATDLSGASIPLVVRGTDRSLSTGATLTLGRDSLDLGLVDLATGLDTLLYVRNAGGIPLEITGATFDHGDFAANPPSLQVPPSDSLPLTISFQPSTPDTVDAVLTLTSTDSDQPLRTIHVRGVGIPFVWPGDTDADGTVDVIDVLPLGQHFGRSGPVRGFGLSWTARAASAWMPLEATYADATGDGTVDQNDLQPIGFNYGRVRGAGKRPLDATGDPLDGHTDLERTQGVERRETEPSITTSTARTIPVVVRIPRRASVRGGLGVAIVLGYDPTRLEFAEFHVEPWIDDGDLLTLHRNDGSRGRFAVALTRKRGADPIEGSGPVLQVTFRSRSADGPAPAIRLLRSAVSTARSLRRDDGLAVSGPFTVDTPTPSELPRTFRLRGVYPNPFNHRTRVRLDLPEPAEVSITIYDVLGRRVRTLPPRLVPAGAGRGVRVDASRLPSGSYLYTVRAQGNGENHRATGRMTLLK